jgi:ribosomal protein S21
MINLTYVPHFLEADMSTKFKKLTFKSGVLKEAAKHSFHEKPSVKKRRKQKLALKKYRKLREASGELKSKLVAERAHYRES